MNAEPAGAQADRIALAEARELLELCDYVGEIGQWRLNVAENKLTWSDAVYRLHGVTQESFAPTVEGAVAFYHCDDRERVSAAVDAAVERREPFRFQLRIVRPDGRVRHVVSRGACRTGADGAVESVFGIIQDVTEDVEPQAVQRRIWSILSCQSLSPTQKVDAVLEEARVSFGLDFGLVSRKDGDECVVENIVGAAPGIAVGDRVPLAQSYCDVVLGEGDVCAVEANGAGQAADHPCLAKLRIETLIGAPLEVDGAPYGAIFFAGHAGRAAAFSARERTVMRLVAQWIAHEISRQSHIDALEESEERFTLAAAGSSVGIWDWHGERDRVFWSDQMLALLGLEPGEASASLDVMRALIHPEDSAATFAAIRAHIVERAPFRVEYRMRHKTLGYRWYLATGQAVWDENGRATRMLGSLMDIHELKTARAAAESAAAAKSSFLATMSHEIRTPLNGVLGMAEVLAGTDLSARQQKMVDTVVRSGRALLALLNDVLDMSKAEAGQIVIERTRFSLEPLIEDARALHDAQATEKGLSVIVDIAPDADSDYLGDPMRIAQVLNNLVSNAVKFTEHGVVRIGAERAHHDGGEAIALTVSDTGIGIDPARLPALFEPFVQADASTTRRFGGTGLGLAICKSLTERMGGVLETETALGEGSTFRATIPVERAEPAEEAEQAQADPAAPAPAPLRVLVVEDHHVNRTVVEALLGALGAAATLAEDGALAVEISARERFDLVLMDLQMPGMDGFEAARRLRAQEAERAQPATPIYALTASTGDETHELCRAAGMDGALAKPISAGELAGLVAALAQDRVQGQDRLTG